MASRCDQDCRNCATRNKAIFAELTDPELDMFFRVRALTQYKKKESIFYQGEPCVGMYFVCTGKVKLTKATPFGREQIVRIANPGELLGEKDLFIGDRLSVSALALEDTQICFIRKEDFFDFLRCCPSVAIHFINELSKALAEAQSWIEALTFMSGRQRLAELLLHLARDYGQSGSDGLLLNIQLTREDLAEMIGVSQETAIRLLSDLKRERLIKDTDHHLVILDESLLKGIALNGEKGSRR